MHFVLLITKEYLSVYKNEKGFSELILIKGYPFKKYTYNTINEDIKDLLSYLADTYNLNGVEEISISFIKNSDNILNSTVEKILGNQLIDTISIEHILSKLINNLKLNKDLYIDEFGINYDGKCYKLNNNNIEQYPYSLLAYHVTPNDFITQLKKGMTL